MVLFGRSFFISTVLLLMTPSFAAADAPNAVVQGQGLLEDQESKILRQRQQETLDKMLLRDQTQIKQTLINYPGLKEEHLHHVNALAAVMKSVAANEHIPELDLIGSKSTMPTPSLEELSSQAICTLGSVVGKITEVATRGKFGGRQPGCVCTTGMTLANNFVVNSVKGVFGAGGCACECCMLGPSCKSNVGACTWNEEGPRCEAANAGSLTQALPSPQDELQTGGLTSDPAKAFEAMDADRDGGLSPEEWQAAVQKMGVQPEQIAALFQVRAQDGLSGAEQDEPGASEYYGATKPAPSLTQSAPTVPFSSNRKLSPRVHMHGRSDLLQELQQGLTKTSVDIQEADVLPREDPPANAAMELEQASNSSDDGTRLQTGCALTESVDGSDGCKTKHSKDACNSCKFTDIKDKCYPCKWASLAGKCQAQWGSQGTGTCR